MTKITYGRKTITLRIKPIYDTSLSSYALENNITKSDVIENLIAQKLNLPIYDFFETRGRKRKENKDIGENKVTLQTNIQKRLFKWIFKEHLTDKEHINSMIEYLEEQKIHAQELELKDTEEWINKSIDLIKTRNFENLDINIEKKVDKEILRYLYIKGLKQNEINAIMDIINGNVEVKTKYKQEIEFTKK
ncbi:MAG: hypothetical protein AABY22_31845 [Nanoarchaeota archaeon]